jgi:hypothetical protein
MKVCCTIQKLLPDTCTQAQQQGPGGSQTQLVMLQGACATAVEGQQHVHWYLLATLQLL